MAKVIEGLLYTEDHEWISLDKNIATIGITDFAQSSLGDIVFTELPEKDEEFGAGNCFGVVESIKTSSDLYTPLSGKVIEKNSLVEDTPENINEDPYGSWLIKVELSDDSEVEKLMSSEAYTQHCESQA